MRLARRIALVASICGLAAGPFDGCNKNPPPEPNGCTSSADCPGICGYCDDGECAFNCDTTS